MTNDKVTPNKSVKKDKERADQKNPSKEMGGREGPDPVRYGDWENNGIASDF